MTIEEREASKTVLRAEATLLRLPLFGLAVKGSAMLDGFEYRQRIKVKGGDRRVERVIRTERDGGSPYPGPLSRRIHMALLGIVGEHGFPFENPVNWTWRDLCRRMGLPNSGRRVGEFKAAIRATWGLRILGLGNLGEIDANDDWKRLYIDCVFVNEPNLDAAAKSKQPSQTGHSAQGNQPEGLVRSEREGKERRFPNKEGGSSRPLAVNQVWLAPWYLESLNALHSAPVDYDLWKRLEDVGPLASRLYEFLLPTFYRRDAIEIAYERLAGAMPVVIESRPSHARRQFAGALDALQAEGVLESSAWGTMKADGRPKLALKRGLRLGGGAVPTTADASTKAALFSATEGRGTSSEPRAETVELATLERFAVDFYQRLGKPYTPYKSDLAVARDLIGRFGEARAFAILPEAVSRLKVRFRNAETLGALSRYFEETAMESERRLEDRQRERVKMAEQAVARAAERSRAIGDDEARRKAWANLPQSSRDAIRAAVLQQHPSFQRHPALIEAACLQTLDLSNGSAAESS